MGDLYWHEVQKKQWILVQLITIIDDIATVYELDENTGNFSPEKEPIYIDMRQNTLLKANSLSSNSSDMTNLHYLHEPGILKNLEDRSKLTNQQPYTFMSNVLIAINPLRYLPEPCKNDYRNKPLDNCAPHPYHIAESAYRQLSSVRPVMQNQSIVISGESGAGKTETSKIILDYLTECTANSFSLDKDWRIHYPEYTENPLDNENVTVKDSTLGDRLMETIPLLEAFGNAKTIRNHNSSRFGKYMRLQFSTSSHELTGASIDTYLLEKSRLVYQPAGERNFHVFYQLLSGANDKQRVELSLLSANQYHYLNQSKETFLLDCNSNSIQSCMESQHLNDQEGFTSLCKAFDFIGVHEDIQNEFFRILSGLLHLGNVSFVNEESPEGNVAFIDQESLSSLQKASELLGVFPFELQLAICQKRIITRKRNGSIIFVKRDAKNAVYARDTIAKTIYEHLFTSIMQYIAISLDFNPQDLPYIGVLDIFGFEDFDKRNGFEQLLINYANESLQRTFNKAIFISEQELYIAEDIRSTVIAYPDNTECIELLSSRHGGIFSTLDNVSRMPNPSDEKLNEKLHTLFKRNGSFPSPHPKDLVDTFLIKHFAGIVEYKITSFIDKNQNLICDQFYEVIQSSKSILLHSYNEHRNGDTPTCSSSSNTSKSLLHGNGHNTRHRHRNRNGGSVSNIFTLQMKGLETELEGTRCNFIRCIKPNASMTLGLFERSYVLQQLDCSGTFQACQVLKVGLPTRILYAEIIDAYKDILPPDGFTMFLNEKSFTEAILWSYEIPREAYQLGTTRLFFRTGKIELLEKLLKDSKTKEKSSWVLQRLKTYKNRKLWITSILKIMAQNFLLNLFSFMKKRNATLLIQCFWRQKLAQKLLWRKRRAFQVKIHFQCFSKRILIQKTFINRPEDKLYLLSVLTNRIKVLPSSQLWILKWLEPLRKLLQMQRKWKKVFIKFICDNTFRNMYFYVKQCRAVKRIQQTVRVFQAEKKLMYLKRVALARKRWRIALISINVNNFMLVLYKRIHYRHLDLENIKLSSAYEKLKEETTKISLQLETKTLKVTTLQGKLKEKILKIEEQKGVIAALDEQLNEVKNELQKVKQETTESFLTRILKMFVCHSE